MLIPNKIDKIKRHFIVVSIYKITIFSVNNLIFFGKNHFTIFLLLKNNKIKFIQIVLLLILLLFTHRLILQNCVI